MRKTLLLLLSVVAVCMCAAPAFAQAGNAPVSNNNHGLTAIAAGVGFAIAVFGGALGQSRIGAAACEGAARNPGAAGRRDPRPLRLLAHSGPPRLRLAQRDTACRLPGREHRALRLRRGSRR